MDEITIINEPIKIARQTKAKELQCSCRGMATQYAGGGQIDRYRLGKLNALYQIHKVPNSGYIWSTV